MCNGNFITGPYWNERCDFTEKMTESEGKTSKLTVWKIAGICPVVVRKSLIAEPMVLKAILVLFFFMNN